MVVHARIFYNHLLRFIHLNNNNILMQIFLSRFHFCYSVLFNLSSQKKKKSKNGKIMNANHATIRRLILNALFYF